MTTREPAARPARRSLLIALALVAASIGLLLGLVDVRAVAMAVGRSDGRYLAAASMALLAGQAVYAARWRLLLGSQASWPSTFLAAAVGQALNLLVPLRLGEPARILVLGRQARLPYSVVTASVVVERVWEQVMRLTALGGAVALGLGLRLTPLTLLGVTLLPAAAALVIALLNRNQASVLARAPRWLARLPRLDEARARGTLERLLAGLTLATSPGQLLWAGLCSLAAWACFWAFHGLVLLALPAGLAPAQAAVLSLGALALAPPSAPTAPGLYHASIVLPLALVGYSETTLTAYAVILHGLLMACLLPLGLVGLLRSGVPVKEELPVA
jgi:uncharacterized protein (TIRG00374 family)